MNSLLKLIPVCLVVFFVAENNPSFSNQGSSYYSYSYNEPIVKVYSITDDIITESKRTSSYQSINSNYDHNDSYFDDNIVFIEN